MPRRRKGAQNPRVRRLEGTAGAANPLSPHIPRPTINQQRLGQIWPNPPGWWMHSVEEWIVYWYLTVRKHMKEGQDFYYQSRVYTQRLYASKDFTQADFLIPYGSASVLGYNGRYTALVLDPFTEFTHNRVRDLERRDELELARYLLVYIAEWSLKFQTAYVIDEALKGRDLSNRGTG